MKKGAVYALCLAALFQLALPCAAVSADSAASAILIHADSGTVLYEKNADERSLIASTTKITTALVVLENCDTDETVLIKPEYTGIEGSSMYLEAGQERTVKELLLGLMLASGNDAAVALACYTAGSVEAFAELMNEKAAELGLQNSSFKNPHGLDAEGHYSSARDLALITAAALQNDEFAEIFATRSATIDGLTFVNHNKLLWNYSGCIGGKTGYTMAAGRTLVSVAERGGLRLICVTLSDPDDWNTHSRLFFWFFENYSVQKVGLPTRELALPLISGRTATVKVGCTDSGELLMKKGGSIEYDIELPQFLYAPVERGEDVGSLNLFVDGELCLELPITALETAERDEHIKLSAWERFKLSWYRTNRLGLYYPGF